MKIAVLLSGGVDSSLALYKLHCEGHDVTAFYLKIWLEDEASFLGDCPWEEDLGYARSLCERLGVPLKVIPLQKEYYDRVVSYTVSELKAGRTPSPDIFCNKRVKFGAFFEQIGSEYDKVASGHYAQILTDNGKTILKMAPDPVKDQTYFLAHLSEEQLSRLIFPIGSLLKSEVRSEAEAAALPAMHRKDSQGICFLGKIKFRDFVKIYLGERKGDIVEAESGKKLGEHAGFWFYTIGQRTGLGLAGGPWYVVEKVVSDNVIKVSHRCSSETVPCDNFRVGEFNWINQPPEVDEELWCKLRHGPHRYRCRLDLADGTVRLLDGADYGIAAGQFTVFYRDDICLGCGTML